MAKAHPFYSIHSHELIRVGACTPRATVGDPAANAEAVIALAKEGHKRGADLLVFPELNISSYAIDDLHLQDALQQATMEAIEAIVAASAKLRPVLLVGAAIPRNGRLYNRGGGDIARARAGRGAQDLPAQLPRILREALVRERRRPERRDRDVPARRRRSAPT